LGKKTKPSFTKHVWKGLTEDNALESDQKEEKQKRKGLQQNTASRKETF
jgi:hypothetical protein